MENGEGRLGEAIVKEFFEEKAFRDGTLQIISLCEGILDEYGRQGYDLTVRQLYYQLVARGHIENHMRSYKRIVRIVKEARLAGLLDWQSIVDRTRTPQSVSTWESPSQIIESAMYSFRIDHWEDQPNYVEVMVEKEALEGVLLPTCNELQVTFTANKGYSSASAMYRAGKRLENKKTWDGKEIHVLYLGDHDPSGMDMDRDIIDRLEMFSGRQVINVNRLALLKSQIDMMDIPENPAKLTDSRAQGYIRLHGMSSWELDAMEPRKLAQLVEDEVNELIDQDLWQNSLDREADMKQQLEDIVENLEDL